MGPVIAVKAGAQVPGEVAAHCALKAANLWDDKIQHWRDKGSSSGVERTERNKQRAVDACLKQHKYREDQADKAQALQQEADRINSKVSPIESFDIAGVRLDMKRAEAEKALLAAGYIASNDLGICNLADPYPCLKATRDGKTLVAVGFTSDVPASGVVYRVNYTYIEKPAGALNSGGVVALPGNFTGDTVARILQKYGEPIARTQSWCGQDRSSTETLLYTAKGIARANQKEVISPTHGRQDEWSLRGLQRTYDGLLVRIGAGDSSNPGLCLITLDMELFSRTILEREIEKRRNATINSAKQIPAQTPRF